MCLVLDCNLFCLSSMQEANVMIFVETRKHKTTQTTKNFNEENLFNSAAFYSKERKTRENAGSLKVTVFSPTYLPSSRLQLFETILAVLSPSIQIPPLFFSHFPVLFFSSPHRLLSPVIFKEVNTCNPATITGTLSRISLDDEDDPKLPAHQEGGVNFTSLPGNIPPPNLIVQVHR